MRPLDCLSAVHFRLIETRRVRSARRGSSMFGRNAFHLPLGLGMPILVMLCGGCSHVQSENEALQKSLEVNGGTKENVVKFAGTVTVDNQPPAVDRRNPLFVFAYDPKNPPKGRQVPF